MTRLVDALARLSSRTLFLSLALLLTSGIFAPVEAQFGNGYTYRREIDVVDAQVTGSHTNFPFLFAGTLLDLRTTGNGGKVEDDPNGYDIIFTSDLAGTTQLAHEVEAYNPATGDFTIWVRVESLVATTKIYLFYGNSSISTFQGNVTSNGVTGVWDDDFLTVLHLHDDFLDATSNGNDVVNTGSTDIGGKIGDGQDFDGVDDRLADEDAELFINGLTAVTVELWIKSDVIGTDRGFIETEEPDGSDNILGLRYDNAGTDGGGNNVIKASIDVGSGSNSSESSINIQTTNWQHVVLTWSSGNATSLYLDGGLDTPTSASSAQSGSITGATKLVIGEGPKDDGASDGWDGRIDEVRISGVARAAGWIQTEYNNQDSPSSFYAIGSELTAAAGDSTPPDDVTNLATGTITTASIQLTWTSPGDDGATGTATTYDIRYSTTAITEENWDDATEATGEPSPQAAGNGESFTVSGLSIATNYYFAIKTLDEAPNESVISNVPNVSTANSGLHWGRDVQNATAYTTGQSRAMGGTSPDIDYMVIDTIAIYLGAQPGDVGLAIYTGGTEADPTGATLLYDFGAVSTTGTAQWYKLGHPTGLAWPKSTVTWLAFKGDDGVAVYYTGTNAGAGDFQTANPRSANNFSTDATVGYPGAYTHTGWADAWYSIYVVHSVEPPNAVTSAVAEISPNSVPANSTANSFIYAIKATIGGTDTGVDSLTVTVPSTFGVPTVDDVQVGGSTVGYTSNVVGKVMSINLTVPVTVTDSIQVIFSADAPTAIDATGKDFASTVDDTGTSTPAQSSTEGSADSDAGDNNSWTVTTTSATCSVGWKCWDGEGSTNDWSEDANWTGNTAPTSTDSVAFNDTSTKDATMDVVSTVAALTIDSGYGAGTLTLAAALTNDGPFIQNGGTLDLGGQTFTQRGDWTYTAGTTPTDGTVMFDDTNTSTLTVTGSHSLSNVTVNANNGTFNFSIAATDTLTVNGTYTHQGGSRIDIENGDVHAKGDVALLNTATGGSGSGTLTINGAGTQNLTGGSSLRQGRVNNIVIDAAGTLNLFDNINVRSTWTYLQGTIVPGASTLVFTVNPTITGSHTVANVNFNARGGDRTVTIAGGTTLTATGTITIAGNNTNSMTLDGGDVHAQGDVVIVNAGTGGGGTATITMNGTGAQALTGPATAGEGKLPNLKVDKSSGVVTLTGHPTVAGTLTLTQGELAHDTGAINSLTVEGTSAVSVAAAGTWTNYSTFTSTVTLGGTVVNAGIIDFNSSAATCSDADVIQLRSSDSPTQRLWSGAGTFGMLDVDVQDQGGSAAITVHGGNDATGNDTNWTFTACDPTAPDAIADLGTGTVTGTSVELTWTAPGDDGATGTATTYDVRYSTSVINDGNWASATEATGEPAPQVATSAETFTVTGLSSGLTYYFAIKTSDEVPNESALSNVPNATTASCPTGWVCWDGEGGTNNWTEDANWTGDVAPIATDSVAFNAMGSKDATVNVASTVANLLIDTDYTGTVTLGAALTNNGNFIQNGGTLDLAGLTLTQRGAAWTYTGGTTPTTGTVVFDDSKPTALMTVTGSHTLPNVTVNAVTAVFDFVIGGGTILTVDSTYTQAGTQRIDTETGDIHLKGDVTLSNTSNVNSGDATFTINGAGTQNLTGSSAISESRVSNLVIDKATGTLNLSNWINIRNSFTYTQGTIVPGTSTVGFTRITSISGTVTLANVWFHAQGTDRTQTINAGDTLTATGTVTISGSATDALTLDGGDVLVQGDLVIVNAGTVGGGTATITMNGTGAQALTGPATAGEGKLPNLTVDKASGVVTLTGHPTVAGTLTLTQGEFAHDTGALNSLTVEGASAVSVAAAGTWTNYSTFTSTVTLGGTVVNAGAIDFNSTAVTCGDADVILIRSSASPTQRLWSGAGTFGMIDVNVQDQAGSAAIDVQDGTDATGNGGNWTFSPCTAYAVTVTPDTTVVGRLPSNGVNYTVDFTVVNTGNVTDDFDFLTTQVAGTAITVVSITGTGVTQDADPDSARVSSLAATDTVIVTVTYSVADVAAGTADTLFFPARSVGDPGQTDDGRLELTVVKPNLTTGKAVNPTGTLAPGTELTYTVTITNDGSDDATSVVVVDSVAVELDFKVGSVVNNLPSGVNATVEYSNDAGSSWTYTPVSLGCSAPANFDSCVTHIRWTLDSDLSYVGPNNTGNVEFVARIQ